MTSFLKGRSAGGPEGEAGRDRCLEDLASAFPMVASCLGGISGPTPEESLPSSTIMVFVDGGRVKFCLSPSEGPDVAFGVVHDPVLIWESISAELIEGNVEWKRRSRPKGGGRT